MRVRFGTGIGALLALLALLALPVAATAQPGLYLPGNGGVQGGMAGVSTATPLDAIGALYWNPAAIGRLDHNEVSIGGAFLDPDIHVSSSLPSPTGLVSGSTRSDSGIPLASSLGVVYRDDDSPLTYGLGIFALGGGGVNFPGDPSNPILSPTGPLGKTVLGAEYASLQLYELNPTVSYQVTDKWVIGVGPTVDITLPSFGPAFFATPSRNAAGQLVFPSATDARPFWGGGFRIGTVYSVTDTLDLGFGFTSKQWLDSWRFDTTTPAGLAQTVFLKAQLPAIYSWGIAWRGIDRLTLATDLRYFDYKDTDLFGTSVRNGGLGWSSAFAVALGANYQLTDRLAVRAGYQYNTNPLASTSTLFNIQAPAIMQDTITVGTTVGLSASMSLSLAYAYSFKNSISGTASQVPGAAIGLSASNQSLLFNLQIKFGGPRPVSTSGCSTQACSSAARDPQSTSDPVPAASLPGSTQNDAPPLR
jgi:long-chain fatty acid transport protein